MKLQIFLQDYYLQDIFVYFLCLAGLLIKESLVCVRARSWIRTVDRAQDMNKN